MTTGRSAMIVMVIGVLVAAAGIAWYVLGQLLLGYAKMEAEERANDNAPYGGSDKANAWTHEAAAVERRS